MSTALITGACINTGVAIVDKFASEGWDVVFTGRSHSSVRDSEKKYREKFPNVSILGYTIDSLTDKKMWTKKQLIKCLTIWTNTKYLPKHLC